MIAAVELVHDRATREPWPWQERRGWRIHRHGARARRAAASARHGGVFHAALCHHAEREIDRMVEVAFEGIEQACA